MVLARQQPRDTLRSVPVRQKYLSDPEQRRLSKALAKIDQAEEEWAELVRALGIAACAREMGLTPQGLLRRVQKIEDRRRSR
jgi:hypothetical protein